MNKTTPYSGDLYALLIGIDCYGENELPNGDWYRCLGGCVRDVEHVEEFLRRKFGLTDDHILKLTATYAGPLPSAKKHDYEPTEPPEQWPTRKNMVANFNQLTEMAKSGDQVYIHYSGHGGRALTLRKDLKGEKGIDEVLVPTDIGSAEANYVRDYELHHLLKAMVDKGLIVTVVLDSCHSGGATRGAGGAVPRGIGSIDTTSRPADNLVASPDELAVTSARPSDRATRDIKSGSGWLLEPEGYTLLAACRPSESAYEYAFDGVERNGALTYWLLDSLKQPGNWLSYKRLHDRILAKIHGQFIEQTPQLQGEGDRVVFGSDRVQPQYSVIVMQVEADRVQVGAGQAAGLRQGAQFAVYPTGTDDFTQIEKRIALLEVTELGAVDSWATITDRLRPDDLEEGAPALLLNPSNVKLQRAVRVLDEHGEKRVPIEEAVKRDETGFLRLANDVEPAELQVGVGDRGEYQILDSAGQVIRNLRPPTNINDANGLSRVIQRLVHLSKYASVLELDNRDDASPLAGALTIDLLGVQDNYDPVDGRQPKPFSSDRVLLVGQWTFLRIRNNLERNPDDINDPSRVLNITVLDLQPDWGISQVCPARAALFESLDPGQEVVLDLQGALPDGYDDGTDVVKVFGTLGTPNFRWLELPALDRPIQPKLGLRNARRDPLDQLLAAVSEDGPPAGMRQVNVYASPSKGWVTEQVELVLRRRRVPSV